MNRRFVLIAVIIMLMGIQIPPLLADTEKFDIDPVHSTACFKVGHFNFGFVRGCFRDISGTMEGDKAKPETGKIEVVIKTESVDTANEKRDSDLRSENFLDSKKYPVMSFKSTKIKKISGEMYEVTGDFTLHGVTRQISVKARFIGEGNDAWGGYRAGGEAEFTIKRSDYGMTKSIPAAGDLVDITLIFEGVRKKKQ